MLAILLGRQRKTLEASRARELLQALLETPNAMRQVLDRHAEVQRVAKRFRHAEHMLFLGRGLSFPIALEGALKLKEISYCHAEGYAAGEMKHGPIALIDAQMPVVVVAPRDAHFEKTFSNLQEVRARDGQIITITTDDSTDDQDPLEAVSAHVIRLPVAPPEILPLLTVLPLQLLAYYIADFRGTDVDQPRNLAKTVTVE